jgi:RNA polymerase II subunit A small phosphatase-like protein
MDNDLEPAPQKLLILDLDETLIHATKEKLHTEAELAVFDYFVYKRPNVNQFLEKISRHYRLGIWSSASDDYVNAIAGGITPEGVAFEFIWGRSKCTARRDYELDDYYFEKRLDKLKKKCALEHIITEKSRNNYGNAVYIKPFMGEADDAELEHLYNYLITLKDVENIRRIEKRFWRKP